MRLGAGRSAGRSHRTAGTPCQDAYAAHHDEERQRIVLAVADGLGSQPLSHLGSQAACDAAVDFLVATDSLDEDVLAAAFEAAREALAETAKRAAQPTDALATTLQVAILDADAAWVAMVGDGAVVAIHDGKPRVLLAPAGGEYANEVVPITSARWRDHLRLARLDGAQAVAAFTDGLTRLLLTRPRPAAGGERTWQPYEPFFASFVPAMQTAGEADDLVERFLAQDEVERSWDDDKCLVVGVHDA